MVAPHFRRPQRRELAALPNEASLHTKRKSKISIAVSGSLTAGRQGKAGTAKVAPAFAKVTHSISDPRSNDRSRFDNFKIYSSQRQKALPLARALCRNPRRNVCGIRANCFRAFILKRMNMPCRRASAKRYSTRRSAGWQRQIMFPGESAAAVGQDLALLTTRDGRRRDR